MKRTVRRALRNPYFVLGCVLLIILLIMLIWGMVGTPYPPNFIDMSVALKPPSLSRPFGTDALGRDVFSRALYATKTAFSTGMLSTAISLVIGTLLGLVSGFSSKAVDIALTRVMDVMRCIPHILFAMMIIAILGSSFINTVVAIVVVNIPNYYRMVRSSVMQVKNREYVVWARLVGIGKWRTMLNHILPNITSPIIVMTSISIARAVLTEASLSYLGMGIQPPDPSWGQMLSDAQRNIMAAPWESVSVGICISMLVFGFNMLGDGLRDLLDVRSV